MSAKTPVALTLERIRDEGGHPEIVEKWIPRGHGFKLDLFGLADIEALFPDHTLYVQVCRDADLTDHLVKHLAEPRLPKLIECPVRLFQIWSWALRRVEGKRKVWSERRYTARIGASGVTFVERFRDDCPLRPVR